MQAFELGHDQLRSRRGAKWNYYPQDVLPAWVADMDYLVAEPVQRAIQAVVETGDYGYPWRQGEHTLASAYVDRMRERFGWEVDVDLVQPVTECVQCMFSTLMTFSEPGDGVVIHTPIYPPFLNTVAKTGRRLVEVPLVDDGTRYVLDAEATRAAVDDRTRVLMLCNPHNPTGRVFTREELTALGTLAVERDLIILSDEIHADLAFPGAGHIPIASLSPEIAARTITITSATKAFNIAGLRAAVLHFGSTALQEKHRNAVPDYLMGAVSVVGTDATVAAWRHAQPWLDAVMVKLRANRDYMADFVAREMPKIKHYRPEATYLAWLDCRALDLPGTPHQFFLNEAKVGLNDGGTFGTPGTQSVRLNFATSDEVLHGVLDRMATAVQRLERG